VDFHSIGREFKSLTAYHSNQYVALGISRTLSVASQKVATQSLLGRVCRPAMAAHDADSLALDHEMLIRAKDLSQFAFE
jgi:hypothetical protein